MGTLRKITLIISAVVCLWACGGGESRIREELAGMTLREKVGQMFIVRPEALDPATFISREGNMKTDTLYCVTDSMKAIAARYPVGGVILFGRNILDPAQLSSMVDSLKTLPGSPLLCIDEEGGRVARLANTPSFSLPRYESMTALAREGNPQTVEDAAFTIGTYVREYGFDVDFAPVADVNTNPENIVIGPRAFSDDPQLAATMVKAYLKGFRRAGVIGCLKHFPGHGDTRADTHEGYAVSYKSWEEISRCEMIPFKAGIAAGAPMVMSAHISVPAVSEEPSTLSEEMLQGKLRGELGFRGVIVTDAMEMGAITKHYPASAAAVKAIQAGADVILCVHDYPAAVRAVEAAVQSGELSEDRIDASVRRILSLKARCREKNP